MASLSEYCRETEQRRAEEREREEQESRGNANSDGTDNAAAAVAAPRNVEIANRQARVVLNDIAVIDSSPSTSRPNSSTSSLDDSVVIVGGAAQLDTIKPIGPNQDEDVIFVTESRQPYRTLATIDLCDSFENSPKKERPTDGAACGPSPAKKTCTDQTPPKSTMGTTKCPICLDMFTMDQILSTMCGHLFCGPCIQGVIKTRKKCPMCNRGLKQNQVHRLFIDPNL